MGGWDAAAYRAFFRDLTGHEPYPYQVEVARRLANRENLVVGAPTGAGKTLTVLVPFLYPGWTPRPARLIYALPLRTLAQSIYREARALVQRAGHDAERVTMQTGEQPDDEFFARGQIIITTYDQVLSGLLEGPYGLSPSQHNLNAAAVVGALVVFDEFHLMAPALAFLTGVAGLHVFRELTQSVWMTATATARLRHELAEALQCADASPDEGAVAQLPTVAHVTRRLRYHAAPLTPEAVLAASSGRTIAICNTVGRAQTLYTALRAALPPEVPCLLLHSRFFKPDRTAKEAQLAALLGKGRAERAVLVATQVVEAGIDISCDDLHTELCPMNALVQRAGRCARYPYEQGTVHVYDLPDQARAWLPYGTSGAPDPALEATRDLLAGLGGEATLTPQQAAQWVEAVHHEGDAAALRVGWRGRRDEVLTLIQRHAFQRQTSRVAHLIREEGVGDLRVIVAPAHALPEDPSRREAVTVPSWAVRAALDATAGDSGPVAWGWTFGDEPRWEPLARGADLSGQYVVCLSPAVARYTAEVGLEVGSAGEAVSPERVPPPRPGYRPMQVESWAHHARAVACEARRRVEQEDDPTGWLGEGFQRRYGIPPDALREAAELCGLLHDLGKLQQGWQAWAEAWQRSKDPVFALRAALAHTSYDPDDPRDRARQREFPVKRPTHAAQGAYLALAALHSRFPNLEPRAALIAAIQAAILAHHGGWLPDAEDLGLQPLWAGWPNDLRGAKINGQVPGAVPRLLGAAARRALLERAVKTVSDSSVLAEYWPLVAYLTRTLRLADRRATAEAGSE
ncbi:MAG TPA: CRISPR-associated helicase Cas3' [Chloroflexota bacterium]|nr:CRISPR-associated helicase Cas3' [Chloroflexota bacterium]